MRTPLSASISLAVVLFATGIAQAHITVASGPVFANRNNTVTFNVPHGCLDSTVDTFAIEMTIPAGFTEVRPMFSDFGRPSVTNDAMGNVTKVTWQKDLANALDTDLAHYQVTLRMRAPDQPFTEHYFAVRQTCRAPDGTLSYHDWVGTPSTPVPDGGMAPEPAAVVRLHPTRFPGWNKYTSTQHIHDLQAWFSDAQIVWRGMNAFSANPVIQGLIMMTPGVTPITDGIHPDNEIWVKY